MILLVGLEVSLTKGVRFANAAFMMSANGTDRLCPPVRKHFRCWWLTGGAAAVSVLLSLTQRRRSGAYVSQAAAGIIEGSRSSMPAPVRALTKQQTITCSERRVEAPGKHQSAVVAKAFRARLPRVQLKSTITVAGIRRIRDSGHRRNPSSSGELIKQRFCLFEVG